MLNTDYVSVALAMLLLLIGLPLLAMLISRLLRRGSRSQLVLAWAALAWSLLFWIASLAQAQDIYGMATYGRILLFVPLLAALLWLRRCRRHFRNGRNTLPARSRWPLPVFFAALLLMGWLDMQSRNSPATLTPDSTAYTLLFIVAVGGLAGGLVWAVVSISRWLWRAGPVIKDPLPKKLSAAQG